MKSEAKNIMWRRKNITLKLKILTGHFTGVQKIITLSFVILMLSFVNIINISALSYESSVGVGFTFNPTLSVSISPSDLIIPNLTPGTTDTSNEISVNVSTNNVYGYNLYVTVGNSTYNNTDLTHSSSNDTFASVSTSADLPSLTTNNTWGYTYSLDNGTTWSSYNGLPLYSATSTRLKKTTELSEDTISFKIAAKSSSTQASGTYTNIINFTAITNLAPITLAEAYGSEGKELYHGYYKMQDMSHTICEKVEEIGAQLQAIDIRDDKVYWISKLADDNCWMTQNLELDLDSTATAGSANALTSENTDLKTYGSNSYDSNNGYSCSNTQTTANCTASDEIITWVPARTTVTSLDSSNFPNTAEANNTLYSYNSGDRYYYPSASGNDNRYYALTECEAQGHTDCTHYKAGNYYNWSASVASNNTSSYTGNNTDAGNSICPKGWKLPKKTTNDFQNLADAYNITSTNVLDLRNTPLYFVRPGYIRGGSFGNLGGAGFYWSGTTRSGSEAYYLLFSGSNLQPTSNNDRHLGFTVRCLAE